MMASFDEYNASLGLDEWLALENDLSRLTRPQEPHACKGGTNG